MKVLHVLYQALPNSAGSSTRSHSLIQSQRNIGIDAEAISSPIQCSNNSLSRCKSDIIDDVEYHRSYLFNGLAVGTGGLLNQLLKLIAWPFFLCRLIVVCIKNKPNILHAHSMYYCCFAAIVAGFFFRIPVVYEIRSRWELNPQANASKIKKVVAGLLEKISCALVKKIVVISSGLASYVEKTTNKKPVIVRNAILTNKICDENKIINKFSDPQRKLNYGYVGSVINLEGIDLVLQSLIHLKTANKKFSFTIYGDGSALPELKKIAQDNDLNVIFKGRIAYEKILEAYDDLDVVINFRRDVEISHTVTPLKPLEAMASGCFMICSDVLGMLEITGGDSNVCVVKAEDTLALADCFKNLEYVKDLEVSKLIKSLSYLKNERTWEANALIYQRLYQNITR